MDPTAALRELLEALRNHDRDTAFDRLNALLDWLSKGGAFPTVSEQVVRYQGWSNHATWAVSNDVCRPFFQRNHRAPRHVAD